MSIQEKNGIWYAVIMYRDPLTNKKKYKWVRAGKSSKEAEKLERSLRTDLDRGNITFSDKTTLEKFLNQWLEIVIKPNLRASTYANYKVQIKNISKNLGNTDLIKLKAPQIQAHYNSELQRPLKKDKDGNVVKTVRPTSVRLQHSILTMALDKAVEWQLIPKNPCNFTDPPQKNKPKNAAYAPQHVQTAIDIAEDTNLYLPVLLGFLCGLRRGEICGLRWSDLNLREKYAKVQHSLDRMNIDDAIRLHKDGIVAWYGYPSKDNKSVLALGPVKTDESEGYVSLPTIVINELRMELLAQIIQMERLGPSYHDHDFVWIWDDGRPHDPDYLYHSFKKMIRRQNKAVDDDSKIPANEKEARKLPDIRPHDMRHTHATLLLRSKIDTKIVSQKLRHKKASFTQDYYQHVHKDMQEETANVMDEMFGKKDD
ncbi:tyrosine-type recombinase/integrase [Anaeroselena agilis]|uniref:Tyrosine-type recombinase/integrase n=1 Tax=Anaeroselena agilis TaxID=3063788 RepID=A0ABU3NZK7_9FIRM|nr:tyrosine-type recombinase/integrase [Selenomonadales bacterium 4137-cl]